MFISGSRVKPTSADERQLTLSYCRYEFLGTGTSIVFSVVCVTAAMLGCLLVDYNEYKLPLSFYIVFLPYPQTTLIWLVNYIYQVVCVAFAATFQFTYFPMSLLIMNQTCLLADKSILQAQIFSDIVGKESKNSSGTKLSTSDQIKVIIEATRQTQQWLDEVQNLMQYNFLCEVGGLSFMCGAGLFPIALRPFGSLMIIDMVFVCLGQLFVYCWMGNRLTTRIDRLTKKLYDTNWYMLPKKQQKDLQIILLMSQNMRGCNGIFCDMSYETFLRVRNLFSSNN